MTLFSKVCVILFPFLPQWSQFAKHCIILKKCSRLLFGFPKLHSHHYFFFFFTSVTWIILWNQSNPKVVCSWLWLWVEVYCDFHELWCFLSYVGGDLRVFSNFPATRENCVLNKALAIGCSVPDSLQCAQFCTWLLAEISCTDRGREKKIQEHRWLALGKT